jgi:ferric-dicitrate binding protein FerR (iron transport regulator)
MNHELLKKYRTDRCSVEELYQVLAWFENIAGTPDGKTLLYNEIWETLHDEDGRLEVNFDHALDEIHHKINRARTEQLKTDQTPGISSGSGTRLRRFLTRAAAILIIPILGYGLYMSYKYQSERNSWLAGSLAQHKVCSSVNAISKVTLPDGTNVWLNHSSSLSYPALFAGEARRVELEGEGYFEVAHNPDMPFIVQVGELEVKALGTTFNVMAYPEDEKLEVSLLDGLVEVHQIKSDGNATLLLQMKPNDFVQIDKESNRFNSSTFYDDRYFAWKDGKLVFEKASMAEMVKRLSRWFNVEIRIESPEALDLTYTATFVDETLPQVLELLSKVSPIDYSISDRIKTADGTFSKTVVVIRHK